MLVHNKQWCLHSVYILYKQAIVLQELLSLNKELLLVYFRCYSSNLKVDYFWWSLMCTKLSNFYCQGWEETGFILNQIYNLAIVMGFVQHIDSSGDPWFFVCLKTHWKSLENWQLILESLGNWFESGTD